MSASPACLELELFDVPLEVLHKILYELGVLAPKDVLNFARTCRAAESAAFGAGAEREFNMVQLRAIADPVKMMKKFRREAGPPFRLGLARGLYTQAQIAWTVNYLGQHFPPTLQTLEMIEKNISAPLGSLVPLSLACGRDDLYLSMNTKDHGKLLSALRWRYFKNACDLVRCWKNPEGMEVLSQLVSPFIENEHMYNIPSQEGIIYDYLLCCYEMERLDLFMVVIENVGIELCIQGMLVAVRVRSKALLGVVIADFVQYSSWKVEIYYAFRMCLNNSIGREADDIWLGCADLCAIFVEAGADCDELRVEAFSMVLANPQGGDPDPAELNRLIGVFLGQGQ